MEPMNLDDLIKAVADQTLASHFPTEKGQVTRHTPWTLLGECLAPLMELRERRQRDGHGGGAPFDPSRPPPPPPQPG